MSYLLREAEPVSGQLVDVFAEQLQLARSELAAYPDPDPEGLHSCRKSIKRLRSLLRLLRGKAITRDRLRLNQHLREVARALSGYRDHEVVLSLLENWAQEAGTGDLATACLGLHRAISKGQPEQSSIPATLKSDLDAVLAVADNQFRTSGLSGSSHRILQKGLRRGRDRMDRAYRNYQAFPKSSNLHELRKRLKDHKYQLQLLAEVHPASAGELPAVSLLESILGNMRDGDLVLSRIMEYANANLSTGDLSQLVLFLESRSSRLAGEFEAEAKGYFRGE